MKGKAAIVTGCNRGIGAGILQQFAKYGADVFAHARKQTVEFEKKCQELSKTYQVNIQPIYFDALDHTAMKNAVVDISKKTKKIDILVNNLGALTSVKIFQMTNMDEIRSEFDVNFFAQIEFTQYISRLMMRHKTGSIVNISSCAGLDGNTGMLQYVSSKAALIGATKRLAIELGHYNIRVNAVAPGLTDTDMVKQMDPELEQETLNHLVIKRKGRVEEIAEAVAFLSSDKASYITGQVLRVDGGMLN